MNNNTRIINIFNSDNSNIAYQYHLTLSKHGNHYIDHCIDHLDQFLYLYQFYRNKAFIISNLQEDFHQDNSCKHNHLANILEGNICCCMQVKNRNDCKGAKFFFILHIEVMKVNINLILVCSYFGFHISFIIDW